MFLTVVTQLWLQCETSKSVNEYLKSTLEKMWNKECNDVYQKQMKENKIKEGQDKEEEGQCKEDQTDMRMEEEQDNLLMKANINYTKRAMKESGRYWISQNEIVKKEEPTKVILDAHDNWYQVGQFQMEQNKRDRVYQVGQFQMEQNKRDRVVWIVVIDIGQKDVFKKNDRQKMERKQAFEEMKIRRLEIENFWKHALEKDMNLMRMLKSGSVRFLKQQIQDLLQLSRCKVCLDSDACMVFFPCRHMATCEYCGSFLDQCPVCRTFIEETVKVNKK